ncbi:MAG: hypothetical protein LC808_17065, partial [Actinobacteria bacterium]|nr:hypothetical protein [Actinomycetota bacterium]
VGNATSTTWGKSTAKSAGTADTFSRVHERFVEPETIQGLPPYVFLWREGGDLPLIPGDCDLELAYSPAAARELPK